jgi:hypothetical protein
MSSRRGDWPQELRKPQVLANFRPTVAERSRPHVSLQQRRPGMSPEHLALLRQLPCTVCHAISRIDPHHLKCGPAGRERAFGRRSTDRWAIPICRFHHDEVERAGSRGERAWFDRWGVDPLELASALWAATGDLNRMIEVQAGHKRAAIRTLKVRAQVNALMRHGLTEAEAREQVEAGLGRGK